MHITIRRGRAVAALRAPVMAVPTYDVAPTPAWAEPAAPVISQSIAQMPTTRQRKVQMLVC
jgi:hypothetical protein